MYFLGINGQKPALHIHSTLTKFNEDFLGINGQKPALRIHSTLTKVNEGVILPTKQLICIEGLD